MRALILGGYGAVGAPLTAELRAHGHTVISAGRDAARADRVVDVTDLHTYREALSGIDAVVNASGAEDPALAVAAIQQDVAFVDITATMGYIVAIERLDPPVPVLLSVGLAPGLTNLLAAAVQATSAGPIDIALLLGAGERHGAAGSAWAYSLLGRRFTDAETGAPIRNYTQPRTFDLPSGGRRRLYRTDYSDQHVLARDLQVPVRTYFGLDSRVATTALALLTWVPAASSVPRGLHLPGTDQWLALARGHDGTVRWACGSGQSKATAIVTAAAVERLVGLAPGVHHLHQIMTLDDVPTARGFRLGARRPG